MALPRVKIDFTNGSLGSVAIGTDKVVGLCITGVTVSTTFVLGTAYPIYKLADLTALGITSAALDANAFIYKHVSEFYAEAPEGSKLWLMGVVNTEILSDLVDVAQTNAKTLITKAHGEINVLAVAFNPAAGYTPVVTAGMDADVYAAMLKAQALAVWATDTYFAPVTILLEGREYTTASALTAATTFSYNRVGVLIGDTVTGSKGAAIGLLLGRIARIPVQRHIGRVKDGALNTLNAFVLALRVEDADVITINDAGYITFRTFIGRSGYFFADDSLATLVADDYRSLARRRSIDKAYRIAYDTMLEKIADEIPVMNDGTLVPAMCKSWESDVVTAIVNSMTAEGNLGVDPADSTDTGVKCFISYNQNIVATNKFEMTLQIKPYGYAKYIDVHLGFQTLNT